MSNFTGPVQIHALDTDTTAVAIEGTGAAVFGSTFSITGPVSAGTTGAQARMALTQVGTVTNQTSGPSTFRIPAGSQICDMWLLCTVSGSGNSQGVAVRIGTSSDATKFGQINASVQSRMFRPGIAPNATNMSAAAWRIGASDVQLHIDVTGVSTAAGAVDNFEAILTVQYVR